MIRIATLLLLAGLVIIPASAAPAPKATKEDLIKAELARLEGTWKVVSFQQNGRTATAQEIAAMPTVTIKGYDYKFSTGLKGKIQMIDPTANPPVADFLHEGQDADEHMQRVIYKLDGDTFEDCISFGDKVRPKEFSSKEGSGQILMKYKRVNGK